mmetsp:Transcript_7937/g.26370  ORF Transcript_7937/g.26370 Transcript_7937/m.26370 type:complete len:233 (-) Transcript_7937:924-1622(-)
MDVPRLQRERVRAPPSARVLQGRPVHRGAGGEPRRAPRQGAPRGEAPGRGVGRARPGGLRPRHALARAHGGGARGEAVRAVTRGLAARHQRPEPPRRQDLGLPQRVVPVPRHRGDALRAREPLGARRPRRLLRDVLRVAARGVFPKPRVRRSILAPRAARPSGAVPTAQNLARGGLLCKPSRPADSCGSRLHLYQRTFARRLCRARARAPTRGNRRALIHTQFCLISFIICC